MKLVVANGPNLNLLGQREPEVYGTQTLGDIEVAVLRKAQELNCQVVFFQTNHEGELIDRIQVDGATADGLVINPGALTHTSYALYDCVRALRAPVVEVHLSNLYARAESFRTLSVTAPAAKGLISGLGWRGYLLAMEFLVDRD